MNRAKRLEKLERKAVPTHPALLFMTADGLRDTHNRPVDHALVGAKVIIGLDPRDM